MERHLKSGVAVNAIDPDRGGTPMMRAAIAGRAEAVQRLIDRGADVNAAGGDGGTALHGAAFLGHEKTVEVLIRNGAKLNVANKDGSTPLDTAVLDEGTTRYFASVLQLDLDENGLGRRKAAIAETLRHHGATAGGSPASRTSSCRCRSSTTSGSCGSSGGWSWDTRPSRRSAHDSPRCACPHGWSSRRPATSG